MIRQQSMFRRLVSKIAVSLTGFTHGTVMRLMAVSAAVVWCFFICFFVFSARLTAQDAAAPARTAADPAIAANQKKPLPPNPTPRRVPAPDFEGASDWLNVDKPLSLKDVRGKVVILDFWTYCCINCIHILPDLKYLEQKYPNELVVIGIHSAKFVNERDAENIRNAMVRYEIVHPVANDNQMSIWREYGINSWPSFVVIDPEGYAVLVTSGEGIREPLDEMVGKLVQYHRAKGTLDETPFKVSLERDKMAPTALRYPGKILADESKNRLFISDSNHNRIVVTDLDGKFQFAIGSGLVGRTDGPFETATFDHPQGMAVLGNELYVCDTENHQIRVANLVNKTVTTVAGTGTQATFRSRGGPAETSALNSPWDCAAVEDKLYIAMAGPHQIWVMDLVDKVVRPFIGSGREDVIDGPFATAALAQPSGLVFDGSFFYSVCSEGSSIRRFPAKPQSEIVTIAGAHDLPNGATLFEFGDQDGKALSARFQHPLGIAQNAGVLYVADSYNHKVKTINVRTGVVSTLIGDGKAGNSSDPARLSEPAGLTVAKGKLYIADTNNHVIRVAPLPGGSPVTTLELQGVPLPATARNVESNDNDDSTVLQPVAGQRVIAGQPLTLEIDVTLPAGFKLNPDVAPIYELRTPRGNDPVTVFEPDLLQQGRQEAEIPAKGSKQIMLSLPTSSVVAKGEYELRVTYQYCRDGANGVCKQTTAGWRIPIELVTADGKNSVSLKHSAP